jgi:hypothetical protein
VLQDLFQHFIAQFIHTAVWDVAAPKGIDERVVPNLVPAPFPDERKEDPRIRPCAGWDSRGVP